MQPVYIRWFSLYSVLHCIQVRLYSVGEGIHHAMEGGKMAAMFLDEAIKHGNYDKDVMRIYHNRWMNKFGYDFKW